MLDQYRVIKKLGTGGTSTVFLVEHQLLHTLRVMKCMSKSSSYKANFIKESRILSQLHHERIPIMYDWEEDDQNYYIIEEYFDGKSLKSYILDHEHITESSIVNFSLQICDTIQYLHTLEDPIIYLDMKPDNIIITDQGVKLVDFGSSCYKSVIADSSFTTGTIGYAAPEQYTLDYLDERADIYGIGMVMYFMVTRTLFNRQTCIGHIEKKSTYSKQLSYVISRCISEDVSHRIESVERLIQELSKLIKRYEKSKVCGSKTSLVIAVAGIDQKVGTTHIALAISKYLNHMIGPSIYIERNSSLHAVDMINWLGNFVEKDGVYVSNQLNILPDAMSHDHDRLIKNDLRGYSTVVEDFGALQMDSIPQFVQVDIRLLVTLGKPWNFNFTLLRETRRLLETTILLVNLSTDQEFQELILQEHVGKVYRVPYIGNVLDDHYDLYVWNAIHTIVSDSLQDKILPTYRWRFILSNVVQSMMAWLRKLKEHKHAE